MITSSLQLPSLSGISPHQLIPLLRDFHLHLPPSARPEGNLWIQQETQQGQHQTHRLLGGGQTGNSSRDDHKGQIPTARLAIKKNVQLIVNSKSSPHLTSWSQKEGLCMAALKGKTPCETYLEFFVRMKHPQWNWRKFTTFPALD